MAGIQFNYNSGNDNKYLTDEQREALKKRSQTGAESPITEGVDNREDHIEYITE